MSRRWSRRSFLGLGGTALAAALAGTRAASPRHEPLRIGFVLPTRTARLPIRAGGDEIAGEAARMGAVMGAEEFGFETELGAETLDVLIASAPDEDAAHRAAGRLVNVEEVSALCGGFSEQAPALGRVAADHRIPFFDIGSLDDRLRGEWCDPYTFHVEASAAMYLDALAQGYLRAGVRHWFAVSSADPRGAALLGRFRRALRRAGTDPGELLHAAVPADGGDYREALEAIRSGKPDAVMLLLGWLDQLDFLAQAAASGVTPEVTGLPEPVTQTRNFYAELQDLAPERGTGPRAALWDASLTAHGAGRLNARFRARWGVPMDPPAWSAHQTVGLIAAALGAGAGRSGPALAAHFAQPGTEARVHKGPGTSFRSWDHQLRQPLYLVKVDPAAPRGVQQASVVDQLPAPPATGADAAAHLDRLGDPKSASTCRF